MGNFNLTARQNVLLQRIVSSQEPVSLQELADYGHVNIRTVQRDLHAIEKVLEPFHLSFTKKKGSGIQIEGLPEAKNQLERELSEHQTTVIFSPEQRQQGLVCDLLLASEPLKMYVFSSKYGVTEATISNDLDKVEKWFGNFGIQLIRKPGLGVYLKGTEKQIREAVSGMLLQNIKIEEWLKLFTLTKGSGDDESITLTKVIDSHLLEFVNVENIIFVEKAIQEVLNGQTEVKLTDREYVGLVVHLTLAIERVKQGNILEPAKSISTSFEKNQEYYLAECIAGRLGEYLNVTIPPIEIEYIAVHLRGSVMSHTFLEDQDQNVLVWTELVKKFVFMVEFYLKDSLIDDRFLIEGLMTHFTTAIKRLELGLSIHNPLLEQIKANYPEVFQACVQASVVISEALGKTLPESEIGYLTMHIGAALIRNKDKSKNDFSAVVVCASGIGTSRFLTSRLKIEFKNIHVIEVIPVNELEQWLNNHSTVDMIISTVSLPNLISDKVIKVTPFLDSSDIESITRKMGEVSKYTMEQKQNDSSKEMLAMARYGEGLLQILRNFTVQSLQAVDAHNGANGIAQFLKTIQSSSAICDFSCLVEDLEAREKKGIFVLDELAMIHAKTNGVRELLVSVFRFQDKISWGEDTDSVQSVRTCLLLAAPSDSPSEHIEMISEISASLIDDSFLTALHSESEQACKEMIRGLLSVNYLEKTSSLLKEQRKNE